jgi:DNA-binding transcriptional ArsR family regulator
MAEDIPEIYYLETVEQLRAIADDLRQRIWEALARQRMTVTQLGEALGEPPARIHYHVRELERLGLVNLVETREKGGILEKYYRPVARKVDVRRSFLESLSPDEHVAAVTEVFESLAQDFARALARAVRQEAGRDKQIVLGRTHLWLTNEEFKRLSAEIQALLEPYEAPRGIEGETERAFIEIIYDARDAQQDDASANLVDQAFSRFRERGPLGPQGRDVPEEVSTDT